MRKQIKNGLYNAAMVAFMVAIGCFIVYVLIGGIQNWLPYTVSGLSEFIFASGIAFVIGICLLIGGLIIDVWEA